MYFIAKLLGCPIFSLLSVLGLLWRELIFHRLHLRKSTFLARVGQSRPSPPVLLKSREFSFHQNYRVGPTFMYSIYLGLDGLPPLPHQPPGIPWDNSEKLRNFDFRPKKWANFGQNFPKIERGGQTVRLIGVILKHKVNF